VAQMSGVIFSDLGQAASFMALDWVRAALKRCLGFEPYPATLNVRPKGAEDTLLWREVRDHSAGVPLAPASDGFCAARLYPIDILRGAGLTGEKIAGAILFPEVQNYPHDKIEIVAPLRLKEHLGVADGDQLTWEFRN
jgi:riboflavin kinase, archaea type